MKVHINQTLRIYSIFMYPGSWKLKKIEASDFCGFSCTRGHENWIESKRLIFVNFHVPGVMKVEENRSVWFLRIFLYPGSWKLKKIEVSDFCGFSCNFILPDYPEMMVNHIKNNVQAFQRSKTCPLVTKKWTNQNLSPSVVVSGIENLMLRVSLQSDHR